MNRGRFISAVVIALIAMFVLSACGSGGDNTSTAGSDAATSGASGATSSADSKASAGSDESSSKSNGSSGNGSSGKSSSGSAADGGAGTPDMSAETHAVNPVYSMTNSQKVAVTKAYKGIIKAVADHDVTYLCEKGYAPEYVEQLDAKGGCVAVTKKWVAQVKAYTGKVRGVALVDKDVAQLAATIERTTTKGSSTLKPMLSFKDTGDSWQMFILVAQPGQQKVG